MGTKGKRINRKPFPRDLEIIKPDAPLKTPRDCHQNRPRNVLILNAVLDSKSLNLGILATKYGNK